MVYIIGLTRKEFLVGETLFPKAEYNEEELARGRKTVLTLSDEDWGKLKEMPEVVDILAQGFISVLDEAPVDKFSLNSDLQAALQQSEASRVELQKRLSDLQKKYEELEAESIVTIQKLQADLDALVR